MSSDALAALTLGWSPAVTPRGPASDPSLLPSQMLRTWMTSPAPTPRNATTHRHLPKGRFIVKP